MHGSCSLQVPGTFPEVESTGLVLHTHPWPRPHPGTRNLAVRDAVGAVDTGTHLCGHSALNHAGSPLCQSPGVLASSGRAPRTLHFQPLSCSSWYSLALPAPASVSPAWTCAIASSCPGSVSGPSSSGSRRDPRGTQT